MLRNALPQLLLKALLNLPATDFTLLLYLIPEKLQADVSTDRIELLHAWHACLKLHQRWRCVRAEGTWDATADFLCLPVLHAAYHPECEEGCRGSGHSPLLGVLEYREGYRRL